MLRDWSAFHVLAKTFAEGPVCLRIAGLTGAARALAVAELLQAHPRPALVLVESMTDAHHWTQDLKFFGAPALEFPGREPRLWRGGRQREADAERAVICRRLAAGEPVVVVVTPEALDAEIVAPGDFASRTLRLQGRLPGPRAPARGARARRLRARRHRGRGRTVEPPRRHRRCVLAEPREPRTGRVLWRRDRVDQAFRPDLPAVQHAPRRAPRPAPRGPARRLGPGGAHRLRAGRGADHRRCPPRARRDPRGRAGEPASPRADPRAPAGRALARGRHVERTGGSPAGGRGGNARDARGSSLRRPVRTARGRDRAMAR